MKEITKTDLIILANRILSIGEDAQINPEALNSLSTSLAELTIEYFRSVSDD